MGIDWGVNNTNFTVVTVSMMYQDKPTVIYMERFSGAESDPYLTAKKIKKIYTDLECDYAFCDNGLYFHFEKPMRDVFGNEVINNKFHFIYYYQNDEKLIQKSKMTEKKLFKVCRNDIMNLYTNTIKKLNVRIFDFEEFTKEKFHNDFLSVGYEVRNSKDRGERLFFLSSKDCGLPTDAFHSSLYAWLGMMIVHGKLQWFYENEPKRGMLGI